MDPPSDISARTERGITNKKNAEAVKFAARKLVLIGDQLNQSYEELHSREVRSRIKLESCLDILRLVLKA